MRQQTTRSAMTVAAATVIGLSLVGCASPVASPIGSSITPTLGPAQHAGDAATQSQAGSVGLSSSAQGQSAGGAAAQSADGPAAIAADGGSVEIRNSESVSLVLAVGLAIVALSYPVGKTVNRILIATGRAVAGTVATAKGT